MEQQTALPVTSATKQQLGSAVGDEKCISIDCCTTRGIQSIELPSCVFQMDLERINTSLSGPTKNNPLGVGANICIECPSNHATKSWIDAVVTAASVNHGAFRLIGHFCGCCRIDHRSCCAVAATANVRNDTADVAATRMFAVSNVPSIIAVPNAAAIGVSAIPIVSV